MENVVASVDTTFEGQTEMEDEVAAIVTMAARMTVTDDASNRMAVEALKRIKTQMKQVKDAWKPFKDDAKAILDRVRDQEKKMLEPLERAEKLIKGKVSDYVIAEERRRMEEAEKLRKLAMAEAEAKLAEAAEAEKGGDELTAGMSLMEAEVYEQAARTMQAGKAEKVSGMSSVASWKIVSIDDSKVPVEFSGMMLRPVDEGAVKRLIKASKGTITIPGVVYTKDAEIRIRANA